MMWNGAVLSLVLLSFVQGACEFLIIGIIPDISASLSVSLTDAGMLISYFAIAYAVGTPVLSVWASRFSRYWFVLLLTLLFCIGNVIVLFVQDYTVLLLDRVFLAALSGTLFSISTTFAPDIAPRKYMAPVIAWINAGFSIAAVFGLPLGILSKEYVSWPWLFVILGVITAADGIAMAYFLPRRQKTVKRSTFRKEITLLKDTRIMKAWGIVICNAAASYCWYSYITPFLNHVAHVPAGWVSPVLFCFGICTIISNLIGGRIAARGGLYILWGVVAVHAALTYSLSVLAPHMMLLSLIVLLLLGMLFYVQSASAQVYFFRISLLFHPGTAFMAGACSPTAFNIGVALGTAVGSLTVETLGLTWTSIPGGLFMTASAFLIWYCMMPERRRLHHMHQQ